MTREPQTWREALPEIAWMLWAMAQIVVASLAISCSSIFRRLAYQYHSAAAARAALFFLGIAERLHKDGRLKPPER
jgi:hypothetical protein